MAGPQHPVRVPAVGKHPPCTLQVPRQSSQREGVVERAETHEHIHVPGGTDVVPVDIRGDAANHGPRCTAGVDQATDGPCGRPRVQAGSYSFHSACLRCMA